MGWDLEQGLLALSPLPSILSGNLFHDVLFCGGFNFKCYVSSSANASLGDCPDAGTAQTVFVSGSQECSNQIHSGQM